MVAVPPAEPTRRRWWRQRRPARSIVLIACTAADRSARTCDRAVAAHGAEEAQARTSAGAPWRQATRATRNRPAKKPPKARGQRRRRGPRKPGPVLRSLSDIYRFFRENTTPVYFVSPTPYNLLGHRRVGRRLPVHHLLRQLRRWRTRAPSRPPTPGRATSSRSSRSTPTSWATRRSSTSSRRTGPARRCSSCSTRRPRSWPTSWGWRSRCRRASCASGSTPRS